MKSTMRIEGGADLSRKLKALGADLSDALELAVGAGGHVIRDAASRRAPKKTGTLARSITVHTTSTPRSAEAEIGTNLEYARIQELGGTVRPVHARLLHWVDDSGDDIFARSVTIPARPYLRPAFDENQAAAAAAIGRVLRAVVERHGD